jgi:diguanylate cyclase (GGDEF)-like protein/PAS domain S-box-containing protein
MNLPVSVLAYILMLMLLNGILYFHNYSINKQQLQNEAKVLLEDVNEYFLDDLLEIRSDLLYLSSRQIDIDKSDVMTQAFLRFVKHKSKYDQLRYIDARGQERIRINYNNGAPYIVGEQDLQNKAHRYYFTESIALKSGDIYISQLDLNMEYQKVEVPLKPVIRYSAPVFDADGNKDGVVILNYLAKEMLERFNDMTKRFEGEVVLLNKEGYYLVGFTKEDEWGFMFPDKYERTFASYNPAAWKAISGENYGYFEDPGTYMEFATLDLTRFMERSYVDTTCRACHWKVVAVIPETLVEAQTLEYLKSLLPLNALLLFIGAMGLWLFFTSHERREKHEEQIQRLHEAIAAERELFISGPTVVLEFKNEYGWPVSFASENIYTVLGYKNSQFEEGRLDFSGIIAPEYLERFAEVITTAQREGLTHFEHEPFEVVSAGGERIWVQDSISIIRDSDGKTSHFLGYINNISPLKAAQEKVKKSGEFVQIVVDSIADPTLVIDVATYEVVLANQAARDMYIKEGESYNKMACYQLSHARNSPCEGENDPCPISMILETKKVSRVTHKHFASDGRAIYVELVATPILDEEGNVVQIIESHRDISHHIELENELKHLASMDKLTQIYNRGKFDEELQRQFDHAKRYDISMGIVMFDVDHFKSINDNYGHDAGDSVLVELTELIKSRIRRYDLFARWGGEEFAILVPKTEKKALETMMEHLRTSVEAHSFSRVGKITASFGATLICENDNVDSMMKRVDRALYQSKEDGRNRTSILTCDCPIDTKKGRV